MGFLLFGLGVVWLLGPGVLVYLLRAELRRAKGAGAGGDGGGAVRLSALVVASSVQVLVGVWSLGTSGLVYAIEPWVEQQGDAPLSEFTAIAGRTAAVCAILWVPMAVFVLVLAVRAVHRGDADRLQVPLVAIVLYAAALVFGAVRFVPG